VRIQDLLFGELQHNSQQQQQQQYNNASTSRSRCIVISGDHLLRSLPASCYSRHSPFGRPSFYLSTAFINISLCTSVVAVQGCRDSAEPAPNPQNPSPCAADLCATFDGCAVEPILLLRVCRAAFPALKTTQPFTMINKPYLQQMWATFDGWAVGSVVCLHFCWCAGMRSQR
jgi:hypothetical protein